MPWKITTHNKNWRQWLWSWSSPGKFMALWWSRKKQKTVCSSKVRTEPRLTYCSSKVRIEPRLTYHCCCDWWDDDDDDCPFVERSKCPWATCSAVQDTIIIRMQRGQVALLKLLVCVRMCIHVYESVCRCGYLLACWCTFIVSMQRVHAIKQVFNAPFQTNFMYRSDLRPPWSHAISPTSSSAC